MGEYIPFSREDVDRASQTNLEEFLRRRGEMLKRSGSEWQWGEGSNKVTAVSYTHLNDTGRAKNERHTQGTRDHYSV